FAWDGPGGGIDGAAADGDGARGAWGAGCGGGAAACAGAPVCCCPRYDSTSCFVMRPPAPVPFTRLRSTLLSRAIRRTSGDSGPAGSPCSVGSGAGGGELTISGSLIPGCTDGS